MEQQVWDESHLAGHRLLAEKATREAQVRKEKEARIGGLLLGLLGITIVCFVLWSMWTETISPPHASSGTTRTACCDI